MPNYFNMSVQDLSLKPSVFPSGLFGSRIRGVYTDDGEEPDSSMKFDVTGLLDLSQDVALPFFASFENYNIGYHDPTKAYGVGGYDSPNWLGGVLKQFRYGSVLSFNSFDYDVPYQRTLSLFLVGSRKENPDGSAEYSYFWVKMDRSTNTLLDKQKFLGTYDVHEGTQWEGDTSEPTDKEGSYNNSTTPVTLPSIPIIDATGGGSGSGFSRVWKVTQANLNALGAVLWSSSFFDTLIKSFSSPIDSIVALNIVPSIDSVPVGTSKNIVLGNFTTDISVPPVTSQFFSVDMGTYTFEEYWASALDYSPYTSIQLFLPYIGNVDISPDDVMGKTLNVVYRCDIITGQILASIIVDGTVLFNQTGNFSMTVPFSGANFGEIYKSVIQGTVGAVTGIAGAVATGGASGIAMGATMTASATSGAVTGSKIQYQRGGATNMSAGYMGIQRCYVIITRPIQSLAVDYRKFQGYPSNVTEVLSNLSGFTAVESIHLENVPATDEEKNEIVKLLQEGVIL